MVAGSQLTGNPEITCLYLREKVNTGEADGQVELASNLVRAQTSDINSFRNPSNSSDTALEDITCL